MCGLLRRYDGVLWGLLLPGVKLTGKLPAAMVEHVSVRTAADAAECNERVQAFVSKPHAGTETVDLLMCAASAGNASAVDALLQAGELPIQSTPSHRGSFPSFIGQPVTDWLLTIEISLSGRGRVPDGGRDAVAHAGMKPRRYTKNRYYKSVMHAAVQYPDLVMLLWENHTSHGASLLGSKQVRLSGPGLSMRPPFIICLPLFVAVARGVGCLYPRLSSSGTSS